MANCTDSVQVFQHLKANFEISALQLDSEIKQLVMLLSNHCHMCWEKETLVKKQAL